MLLWYIVISKAVTAERISADPDIAAVEANPSLRVLVTGLD